MDAVINALAFPAPKLPLSYYEGAAAFAFFCRDGHAWRLGTLLTRRDLIWLYTSAPERIPALCAALDLRRGEEEIASCRHIRARATSRDPSAAARGREEAAPGEMRQEEEEEEDAERLTILYSHGNAEDIALHIPFVEGLARWTGADVLSYEYVGYSLSRFMEHAVDSGESSEAACYRSIDAAWRYLTVDCKIPPRRIVIFGRSIGSGPSVHLASQEGGRIAGLFLQSPIESAIRCALGYVSSVALHPLDIFRNYEKIASIACPIAIVHGEADTVAPISGGKALLRQARQPFRPLWLPSCGHNNIPADRVFAYMREFIAELKGRPKLKGKAVSARHLRSDLRY